MSLALKDMGVAVYLVIVMAVFFIGSIIAYRREQESDNNNDNKGEIIK